MGNKIVCPICGLALVTTDPLDMPHLLKHETWEWMEVINRRRMDAERWRKLAEETQVEYGEKVTEMDFTIAKLRADQNSLVDELASKREEVERQAAEIERLRGALLDAAYELEFTVNATNIEHHVYKTICEALKGGTP